MSDKSRVSLIENFAQSYNIDPKKVLDTLIKVVFKPKVNKDNGVVENVDETALMSFLLVCQRYSLDPFRKEIIPFKDKSNNTYMPVVTIDGWLKVITSHSQCDGFQFEFSDEKIKFDGLNREVSAWCKCTMYRKDWKMPVPIQEFSANCYRPPLNLQNSKTKEWYTVNTPWQSHFERMLQHKTMIQTARYVFGFGDIYELDEAERISESREAMNNSSNRIINTDPIEINEEPQYSQAALPHNQGQTVNEYFESNVDFEHQEKEPVAQKHQSQQQNQTMQYVDATTEKNISQMISFAEQKNTWNTVLDQFHERFSGDVKDYALSKLNEAYKLAH